MNLGVVAMPGSEHCGERLAEQLGAARCRLESRRFPDGEIYLRLLDEVQGRHVAVVAQLRDPDPQLPGLLFLADALRELGASSVGLVAPYLPYMRQDIRFHAGEAMTSRSFAKLVSNAFGWLVTMDPHLHRIASLDAIYDLRAVVVPSAASVAAWVRTEVLQPHIVGPDEESEQWVSDVAARAGCAHSVLRKHRSGDRSVELRLPNLDALRGRTPVLVDDIISSGQTMATTVRELVAMGFAAPICVGVHPVFAGDALALLCAAGAARIVSCNTLLHPTNAIDVTTALAESVRTLATDLERRSCGALPPIDVHQPLPNRAIQNRRHRAAHQCPMTGGLMDLATQTHLTMLRELLTYRQTELRAEVRAAQLARQETAVDTTDVSDQKEGALQEQLVGIDSAQEQRDINELAQVELALKRLYDGTYGNCVDCDEPIPLERLRVQPATQRCAVCQLGHERTLARSR